VINRHVHHLLDANIFGIALMDQDGMGLHSIFNDIDGEQQSTAHYSFADPEYYVTRCVRERREFLIDQNPELEERRTHKFHTLSRLVSPLCIADKVLGVMTIQSRKRHAYGAREQMIFRTLCAYAAIAISNSLAHNDLASTYQNLKETQVKLVQSEKMASLGNLVAGIAHEINTPLGTTLMAISGVENALQEMKAAIDSNRLSKSMLDASTAEALEYTDLALRTASRAADLVTLFKTVAAQGGNDQLIEVDLADYLRETDALLREPLALRGCQLEINVPTALRLVIVHDALIEALTCVFTNVFDHAFANGRTGLLRLSAWANHNGHENQVIIKIEDNGHGIAPEHLPKVFDPFFTTQSGAGGHVGLGLYVAFNHITQRMKSDIRITSTMGQGTTVTIYLKTGTLITAS
jgi:signal transduction histidine kinase